VRTHIALDDGLLDKATRSSGLRTKRAVVQAAVYLGRFGVEGVLCAKLHAAPSVLCPFERGVREHVQERRF
jgi:hypothetical protein